MTETSVRVECIEDCATSLGRFLKDRREAKRLTQSEVAARLGYGSPQFISNIERGISNVPIKSLRILIEIFGLSPAEVVDIIVQQKRDWLTQELAPSKTASSENILHR